eukprot:6194169-Pleurochrysis_carterae.AAC.5
MNGVSCRIRVAPAFTACRLGTGSKVLMVSEVLPLIRSSTAYHYQSVYVSGSRSVVSRLHLKENTQCILVLLATQCSSDAKNRQMMGHRF